MGLRGLRKKEVEFWQHLTGGFADRSPEFDVVKTVGVRVVKGTTGAKGDVVKISVGWCCGSEHCENRLGINVTCKCHGLEFR